MRSARISRTALALVAATALAATAGTAVAAPAGHTPTAAAQAAGRTSATVEAAQAAAFAHAAATGVGAQTRLRAVEVMADQDGKRHVRFAQLYRGVPVVGGDLVVHLGADCAYLGVTRAAGRAVSLPSTAAELTPREAEKHAAAQVRGGQAGAARLVVDHTAGASTLAYQVAVTAADGAPDAARTVLVDAATGSVLRSAPTVDGFLSPQVVARLQQRGETPHPRTAAGSALVGASGKSSGYPAPAVGKGLSLFSGTVTLDTTQTAARTFLLKDTTRGDAEIRDAKHATREDAKIFTAASALTDSDDTWGDGTTKDNATAAVDASHGLTATFDFYKKTFGRNGIRNDGAGPRGVVHWGTDYGNAAWYDTCHCMIYGDGDGQTFTKPLVQLDVTGHELTHGVVAATAGLEPTRVDSRGNQYGEPGALNESLADIFGSATEFSTNPKTGNYLMGEQLGLDQGFLRRLDKPSLDRLEGTIDYWTESTADAEVHAGSGVSSHAFYLLAEGSGRKTVNGVTYDSATYDGSTVQGIGRDKALRVFYQALTRYMVSTTDFHDAREATLKAAGDLYGTTSTEYAAVDKAWAAVDVTAANRP
ncbi:flagellar biosynthesis anti-sigma factor FlgM [Streptomyces sp. Tu 6176]|uniref:M4 family metallopeptidase n=1 Tax=Streptomyces sp. Tu 6176 TaxID=1470557 RepID=UPI000446B3BC|nr:M4 family metallopeptidase [Streptomyces sp. Tu 6176]EYT82139.1 flagellar biosynthesis anti-sigma factor FlgM [Streptomyces sp. Tu 6176]